MRFIKPASFFGILVGVSLFVTACGGTSSSTTAAGSTTTPPTATPVVATATATTTVAANDLPIKTASVLVSGAMETVLVTAQGITLYYRTSDTPTSVYSGSAWPPLLASGGTPTSSVTLPGKLSTLQDANGMQVIYNNHPLYTYAGDNNTPGQATGDGVGRVWYAATPSLS
jgi:predicted lipoprotein with Yx(FWY)xxD motif